MWLPNLESGDSGMTGLKERTSEWKLADIGSNSSVNHGVLIAGSLERTSNTHVYNLDLFRVDSQSPSQDRPGLSFSPAPALDLRLSPSCRHTSSLSPSPSSPSSLSPSSPLDSPGSSSSPQPHLFSRVSPGVSHSDCRNLFACLDATKSSDWNICFSSLAAVTSSFSLQEPAHPPGVEGGASPQGYHFYLPVGSPPGAYIPSSAFVGQNQEKLVSPDSSLDGQLACRWMKVRSRSIAHRASAIKRVWALLHLHHLFSSVPSVLWLTAGVGRPHQRLPCQAWKGFWVLLPVGGVCTEWERLQRQVCSKLQMFNLFHLKELELNIAQEIFEVTNYWQNWLVWQVQNADSHPHAHQREAAPLPDLQQELLTSGEPEDPHALAHRWGHRQQPEPGEPSCSTEVDFIVCVCCG